MRKQDMTWLGELDTDLRRHADVWDMPYNSIFSLNLVTVLLFDCTEKNKLSTAVFSYLVQKEGEKNECASCIDCQNLLRNSLVLCKRPEWKEKH